MSGNIYGAPGSDLESDKDRDHYLSIAKRQKHLIYTFFMYIVLSGLVSTASAEFKPLFQLLGLPLFLAIIVLNIRLSLKLYGTLGKVIMIFFGIIPGVNIFVILAVSSRANSTLKKAGYNVGFLGVNISDMENANNNA